MDIKALLQNVGLAIASMAFVILCCEVGLRAYAFVQDQGILPATLDPHVDIPEGGEVELGQIIRLSRNQRLIYELRPNLSVVYAGARVATTPAGTRSPGPGEECRSPGLRVVGIGDSFMFGQGVSDDETYLAVLGRGLQSSPPNGCVDVVNLAVPGYNTVMEVESLKEKGLGVPPDLVIVEFVGNDLTLPNFVRIKRPVFSLRRPFLLAFLVGRLRPDSQGALWTRLWATGLEGIPQEDPEGMGGRADPALVPERHRALVGWDAYETAMKELRRLSEIHGFPVVSLSLAAHSGGLKERALALSRQLGFHVLDMGPAFMDYLEEGGWARYLGSPLSLSDEDGHPSALAHRMAGGAIHRLVATQVLTPAAPRGSN